MVYQFVRRKKAAFPIATMCRVLGVSTSGYYAWCKRGPSPREQANLKLMKTIREIYNESRGTYGAPRVHAELVLGKGIRCGKNRVARLMRKMGLEGAHRRRRQGITRRRPGATSRPDLVNRNFAAAQPDELWVADMTQHETDEGLLYLAIVMDAFSRQVTGWAMGDRPVADLAVKAVNMAVWNRQPTEGVIHHSDHGSQYTSLAFGHTLRSSGIVGSMGTVGDALDNAMAESFFATLQIELLDRHKWPTRSALSTAIFEYIEGFYNRRRRHSALGYLSPVDFERRWARLQKQHASIAV